MNTRSPLLALSAAITLASLALAGPLAAQPAPARIRGTIESVTGKNLSVMSRDGDRLAMTLAPDAVVTVIAAADIADIKPGSYIGTAAMPQKDGSLVAMEVQVFPEAMRGAGEGSRPYDLQPQSTMTNGTVGDVAGVSGRTLTLKYQDGEKHVLVPPGAPVITYQPGTLAMLVAGGHVIVTATKAPDGTLTASRVALGKDGLVPPM
jgi:hypothetical protein